MTLLRQRVEELLLEPPREAARRSRALWATLRATGRPLVLHGAGRTGTAVLNHLKDQGDPPLGFVDLDPDKAGTHLDGLPVLSPAAALDRWGTEPLYLVTVLNCHHSYPSTRDLYRDLGAQCAPVLAYFWANPERFLPYYAMSSPELVLEDRNAVLEAFDLLDSELSRRYVEGYLRWRLHLDYDALPDSCGEAQYFPASLIALGDRACFIDCGAFDGDTFTEFARHTRGGFSEAHLFEPDPGNFRALQHCLERLPAGQRLRVHLHPEAVGRTPGTLRFRADGSSSSSVDPTGMLELPIVTLDEVLVDAAPTLLKLDIEGAEEDALRGAEQLLRKHRPAVAACIYHKPRHPWRIPLLLSEFLPSHHIAIRPHGPDGWEWVAYAIPK